MASKLTTAGEKIYRWDRRGYARRREERMVRFLDDFFWKSFFYLRMNRIEGDYLEFGLGGNARSFRLAWKYKNLEYPAVNLIGFDSFEGLPRPMRGDRHPQWREGMLKVAEKDFHRLMRAVKARKKDYRVVPGFFPKTLKRRHPVDYGIERAAMVMIDCDLFASAALALDFAADIFADGAILAFDDWFCFDGRPDKGEQRAFAEFRRAQRGKLSFSEFQNFGWHGKSFLVHRRKR